MDVAEEQYKKILGVFPDVKLIKNNKYHLKIPIKNEIFLDINFKNYPKRPKANLTKSNGKIFKLYRVISSLRGWYSSAPPSILELIMEIFSYIKSLELNQIQINKEFLDSLMDMCQKRHPIKLIGLLGVKKGIVSEYILPSRACTDPRKDFAIFRPTCIFPLDFSYEGTFISRPSGELSTNEKLNIIFKKRRFTMLIAYPYNDINCLRCFDTYGNILESIVIE